VFKIQIFHPGSGFYLNTNHESDDLEELKSLLDEPAFAGPRYRIVDEHDTVHHGPVMVERKAPMTIEDLAQSLGVPVLDPREAGYLTEDGPGWAGGYRVGYTLEAVHEGHGGTIVSIRLEEALACAIMREVWPVENFWDAPGGSTIRVETAAEAEAINRILGSCQIRVEPGRHRWLFHAHLV
jgi:hypothetical protein